MTITDAAINLYEDLGVKPVINAAGAYTILGGSLLSPAVEGAMEEANHYFVEMRELLASSGRTIAGLLECEAAYITSGAAGALALAAAACMTGQDAGKMERLPDPTGMKSDVLIQRGLRVRYDRCVEVPGAKLRVVGDEKGTTRAHLAAAIDESTAAVHYLAPGGRPGVLPLGEVIEFAHARGVPVIVDAAGRTYPLEELRSYTRMGADLVCYAGKYFDAPHSTGLLVGKKELVEAASMNGFIGFETSGYRTIGRPMKLDRQEIVGVVVALRQWLTMNHEERYLKYGERAEVILDALRGLRGVEAYRLSGREPPLPVVREAVRVTIDPAEAVAPAAAVIERLREGSPAVWVMGHENTLTVSVAFFRDGEEAIVAERLRQALSP